MGTYYSMRPRPSTNFLPTAANTQNKFSVCYLKHAHASRTANKELATSGVAAGLKTIRLSFISRRQTNVERTMKSTAKRFRDSLETCIRAVQHFENGKIKLYQLLDLISYHGLSLRLPET